MTLRRRSYLVEAADPSRMSEKQFWAKIDRVNPGKYATSSTVDWGASRGQGKRHGRMVMGGMSDAPKGKKSYTNILGKLQGKLSRDDWDEAKHLEDAQKFMFAKAMAAGFSPNVAFLVSYTRGRTPMSRREAFKLATEKR